MAAGLLVRIGAARRAAGELEQARDAFAAAVEEARRTGDTATFVDAALGIGTDFGIGYADELEIRLLEEALTALAPTDVQRRAQVLARLARALHLASDPAAGSRSPTRLRTWPAGWTIRLCSEGSSSTT
ncbi:hypothetical protein [Pseudonocardia humida]|uniref:Tetratricopeptide repeat protein n=1 Tax=Pseudonocardia humida TaxID=2800819 RepID=A0ABT1ADG9_9PSEU|nr:hypothetical protein [Pseudonocardia humida]MCO1660809.1 hypothetical protein [Pseudonocardia humida]